MKKEKLLTIGLILATVILAGLAILTVYKMNTSKPVAPTVPQTIPQAAEPATCELSFSVVQAPTLTPTGTLVPTPTLTLTPAPTATPTPLLGCYRECESDDDCDGDTLRCQTVSGVKRCVNLSCPGENDCVCNVSCWGVCGQDSECPGDLDCQAIDSVSRCVNTDCERDQDCECAGGATPTPTPGGLATYPPIDSGPTPTPVELPEAGISLPTIGAVVSGIILAIVSILLVL